MNKEELAAWLRLLLTPGVGSESARKLLAAFGLPQTVLEQPISALCEVVSSKQASALRSPPETLAAQLDLTWHWLQNSDGPRRRVVVLGDANYPIDLLAMDDPPLLLYVMGDAELDTIEAQRSIAMVGSRNPTAQGVANARAFAKSFASSNLTVISGLALGVDGAAHEGALEGASSKHLATVAVVGTGLDRVYPKQHFDLAHRIAGQGLLISEYQLGTPPLTANFPKRNRLIAALASGTLVVEATLKSGSLITARLAAEQGKEVFAIPGSIHATQARGCHALIKQGAKLVESAEDVLEELRITPMRLDTASLAGTQAQAGPENTLLNALGFDPASLDVLMARTGLDTAAMQAQLLTLELQGHVARLPGGLFQRLALGGVVNAFMLTASSNA